MPPSPPPPPLPPSPTRKNITIGLSGASSSGKTTLARLLRSVFNIRASAATNQNSISLFILHEDDFYKPDDQIPITTTPITQRRVQDWDSASALNLPLLSSTLAHISRHGTLPPGLQSKEDATPLSAVSDAELCSHRETVRRSLLLLATTRSPVEIRLCVLEGFLLYPAPSSPLVIPAELLQIKLFLRSSFALTKARREARAGYVTSDGFWQDPPGYVDEVVWPRYVAAHAWMFVGGDVEGGEVREGVGGIEVGPGRGECGFGGQGEEEGLLGWAVRVVVGGVRRVLLEGEEGRIHLFAGLEGSDMKRGSEEDVYGKCS